MPLAKPTITIEGVGGRQAAWETQASFSSLLPPAGACLLEGCPLDRDASIPGTLQSSSFAAVKFLDDKPSSSGACP